MTLIKIPAALAHVNTTMRRASLLLYVSALTCGAMWASAAQTGDQQLANTLLGGVRDRIERLQSGTVECEILDKAGATVARRFIAFDNRAEKVRSDAEVLWDARTVRIVHTKNEFLQFVSRKDGGLLTRLNPGEESRISQGMPVDARAVGLCEYRALDLGARAEGILKNMEGDVVVNAVLENDIGVVVFEAAKDKDSATHVVLWIDTAHDYVPVRREVRCVAPDGRSFTVQRLETSWGEISKTWVPIKSVSRFFSADGAVKQVEEIRLTWKSVNEKVLDELFTVENLKLPKNTYIVDTRLGQRVLEEVVGMDRPLPGAPAPREFTWTRIIVITLSVALLLAFGVLAVTRRRGAKAASSPHGGDQ